MFSTRIRTGVRTLATRKFLIPILFALVSCTPAGDLGRFVDPTIGSEGLGRVFVGPSMPFGMAKPGPDCTAKPNSGWAPMPQVVSGFSQTHVSGTGGGPKYGNILIQPFSGALEGEVHEQMRQSEDFALGYYATTYENGIRTEITASERASFYRISYGDAESANLLVDCGFFLGENPIPKAREAQQFEDSGIKISSDSEIIGFSKVSGGWNNGSPYTVYFCLQADKPFSESKTWRKDSGKSGALVSFPSKEVGVKIGISFISCDKARSNIPSTGFDEQLATLRSEWEKIFSKIEIKAPDNVKRQFYTALYHTCLMPVDRSGENPSWDDVPYYDDYYALWDTYRTSVPLLTLIAPDRQRDMVNSLLNIYRNEGYMPDARSGNCNGRTQGGSHGEVVVADAIAKGLDGIDYSLALEAMLKDATVPPQDHEKEGRGGLEEYNTLGYIPYGIPRAGTRTVEYSLDDWCISQVARHLGKDDIADEYLRKSSSWKNLWRADYIWDEMSGFIMPKDRDGNWLDRVPWGESKVYKPTIPYTPITKVAPWYLPWWNSFFYEALSEEYSLSVPHDVPGLIEACGGEELFKRRLDLFFEKGYYNVANEPSFLTPCLYHWIGRPDLSSARIEQIIADNYDASPDGLPGNDDSGAMSSWYIFNMLGIYPNAGTDYYLVHTPLVERFTIHLPNGKVLKGKTRGSGHFKEATIGGRKIEKAFLTHSLLMEGGEMVFHLEGERLRAVPPDKKASPKGAEIDPDFKIAFTLNRQYRTWDASFTWDGDTLEARCNGAIYRTSKGQVQSAEGLCYLEPKPGAAYHDTEGTFCFISKDALSSLLQRGYFIYNGITWRKVFQDEGKVSAKADVDGTIMTISTDEDIPFIEEMTGNPLGIDWKIVP